jgi:hypothetical protein
MKAKIVKACTVDNKPAKVGDIVDLTEHVLKNMARKGLIEPADAEAKRVDIKSPATLGEVDAKAQCQKREKEFLALQKRAKKAAKQEEEFADA